MISVDLEASTTTSSSTSSSSSPNFSLAGFVIRPPVVRVERMSLPVDSEDGDQPPATSVQTNVSVPLFTVGLISH